MNREDVLSMVAGPEMDACVAERVMHWAAHPTKTHVCDLPDGIFWRIFPKGPVYKTRTLVISDNTGRFCAHAWTPSSDIAAAWDVVDRLGCGDTVKIVVNEYGAVVSVIETSVLTGDDHLAKADKAPLAICRAALLATLATLESPTAQRAAGEA